MPVPPAIRLSARGAAGAAEAWERYARPSRWPEWSPQIARVDAGADRIAPGLTGTVSAVAGVGGVRFVVDAVDEPARTWCWRVVPCLGRPDAGLALPPLGMTLRHVVEPDGSGSVTRLEIRALHWAGAPVAAAYAPLARVALARLVHA